MDITIDFSISYMPKWQIMEFVINSINVISINHAAMVPKDKAITISDEIIQQIIQIHNQDNKIKIIIRILVVPVM